VADKLSEPGQKFISSMTKKKLVPFFHQFVRFKSLSESSTVTA
jgi:hypothetical protein